MAKELKESKEIVVAIAYVGVKAIAAYKQAKADGKVDLGDIGVAFNFLMDPELKAKVDLAIEGADKLSSDFEGANIFDLVKALVEVEPQVMELVKEIEGLKA